MSQWLIVLLVIVVLLIIWYLMRERSKADERQRLEASRRVDSGARAAERAPLAAAGAAVEGAAAESAGRLQGAADRAAGLGYERATDTMDDLTAGLADARKDADRSAAHLASQADEALASVQAAASTHGGAVPGDGTGACPPGSSVATGSTSMPRRWASR